MLTPLLQWLIPQPDGTRGCPLYKKLSGMTHPIPLGDEPLPSLKRSPVKLTPDAEEFVPSSPVSPMEVGEENAPEKKEGEATEDKDEDNRAEETTAQQSETEKGEAAASAKAASSNTATPVSERESKADERGEKEAE